MTGAPVQPSSVCVCVCAVCVRASSCVCVELHVEGERACVLWSRMQNEWAGAPGCNLCCTLQGRAPCAAPFTALPSLPTPLPSLLVHRCTVSTGTLHRCTVSTGTPPSVDWGHWSTAVYWGTVSTGPPHAACACVAVCLLRLGAVCLEAHRGVNGRVLTGNDSNGRLLPAASPKRLTNQRTAARTA